ncbi:MAG: helix-turn-helix transcriptional regulator [Erysipelotrichales bacterium]|nr:helix-turn-helix transcriptional regulator [Erysipelotrichales bacterium]
MTELKHLRQSKKMTQKEAAKRIGVSLRSYISYENDEEKSGSLKYRFLLEEMRRMDRVDEEHGVLSIDEIREAARPVL